MFLAGEAARANIIPARVSDQGRGTEGIGLHAICLVREPALR